MTRLWPIYACDVLSFLPYDQLQQTRLVSRSLNNTIVAHPVRLKARRMLSNLDLTLRHAEERPQIKVGDDGYVACFGWGTIKNWKNVQEEWGCCHELKADASSLVGERIIISRPSGDTVTISVFNGFNGMVLWCRNEMTTETAFGVLHLLDHLRDTAIEFMRMLPTALGIAMNSSLFQHLSDEEEPYKLHVDHYSSGVNSATAEEFIAEIDHLSARELFFYGTNLTPGLDFAVKAKPYCKRLKIRNDAVNQPFDVALQHFQTALLAVGCDVVAELVLYYPNNQTIWPVSLPPREEMEALGWDSWGRDIYRQRGLRNIHSGERFDIVVETQLPWPGMLQGVESIRFIFREEKYTRKQK